jgi:hypothetical protein
MSDLSHLWRVRPPSGMLGAPLRRIADGIESTPESTHLQLVGERTAQRRIQRESTAVLLGSAVLCAQ